MSFFLLAFPAVLSINASIYIGAYVLEFFGISLPVLRVAGGLGIAIAGCNQLNSCDEGRGEASEERWTSIIISLPSC